MAMTDLDTRREMETHLGAPAKEKEFLKVVTKVLDDIAKVNNNDNSVQKFINRWSRRLRSRIV